MGILNLTPDSFYDGGESMSLSGALSKTERMLAEGADFIDIGAMSSRPFSAEISLEEELKRVGEILPGLVKEFPKAIFSIDTYRSEVADFCLSEGACMINDITSARKDEQILDVVAKHQCPYISMHMLGSPELMQHNPEYENILVEIGNFFSERIRLITQYGIKDVILDVGFGFGKSIEDNFSLLKKMNFFTQFNSPILVGISRKSMIYKSLQIGPKEALNGTTALHWEALRNGANILRVHDVREAKEVVDLYKIYQRQ